MEGLPEGGRWLRITQMQLPEGVRTEIHGGEQGLRDLINVIFHALDHGSCVFGEQANQFVVIKFSEGEGEREEAQA